MCLAQEDLSPNLYKLKPSDFDCLHIFLQNTPLGLDERWKITRRNSLEKDLEGTVKGDQERGARRAGAAGRRGWRWPSCCCLGLNLPSKTQHQPERHQKRAGIVLLGICYRKHTKNTECTIDWERGRRRETLFKKG